MIVVVCADCDSEKLRAPRGNMPEYVARLPCVSKNCPYRPRQLELGQDEALNGAHLKEIAQY